MNGVPLNLVGPETTTGQAAPSFSAQDPDFQNVQGPPAQGRVVVLASVPSIETPICDMMARRLIAESRLMPEPEFIIVSMDLPPAWKRWSQIQGEHRARLWSDHLAADFGRTYGALIQNMRLLTRTLFVVDPDGAVRFAQYVPDLIDEPDYNAGLQIAWDLSRG
jgi:thiol peroxidase